MSEMHTPLDGGNVTAQGGVDAAAVEPTGSTAAGMEKARIRAAVEALSSTP
ncbi:hypothetical protein ACFVX3_31115 [Rhodococcus erythropolis]